MPSKNRDSIRVLHIGNVANNAYNIAKALRERTDIEADCYTDHYKHYISQPEWEDADIGAITCSDDAPVDWNAIDLGRFSRPDWYFETRSEALARGFSLTGKECLRMLGFFQSIPAAQEFAAYWRELAGRTSLVSPNEIAALCDVALGRAAIGRQTFPTASAWRAYLEKEFRRLCVPPHAPLKPDDYAEESQDYYAMLFRGYDIIQTYGISALFQAILHCPSIPRVTFEHGTMREFPFQHSARGRKAMLAYKTSFANIITNADSIHNMRRMGLRHCTFIPHPVDDAKFCPLPDPVFRQSLLDEFGASQLFLAPARQNWELKGNHKVVLGFAAFIRSVGPGAKLLLGAWGQEVERTRRLVRELSLDEYVAWIPPLPKRLLARYINASDAVLDQFVLGAFGTTTPEALACGKPVFLYYRQEDHAWCLPEGPPIVNVRTADEIAEGLTRIHENPAWAELVGRRGLDWFRRHHSLDVVIAHHTEIYRKIQNAPQCFSVAMGSCYKEKFMKDRIVCIVSCEASVPEVMRTYMDGIDGLSILEIMDARLRTIVQNPHILLTLSGSHPKLENEARRLGWVVVREDAGAWKLALGAGLRLFKGIIRADFVWLCSLDEPFLDREQILDWHQHFTNPKKIFSGESNKLNPYIPHRIYSRAFVFYRFLLRMLFRAQFDKHQCLSIMVRYGLQVAPPALPQGTMLLNAHNFSALAQGLSAKNFRVADLHAERSIEDLYAEKMRSASKPHEINALLNIEERKNRREELRSFPTYVGLNMTSRCNAHCVFCSIQAQEQKFKDAISLQDIKKMDWLKYVGELAIWGGIGDSLVNKEFLPIFHYLREAFPFLKLSLSTNGILMNKELCHAFAGNLGIYNVSLNAARKDTWEKIMRAKGFDTVCSTFALLSKLRPTRTSPSMHLSMVLTRENIREATEFVELAHTLGADSVRFVHYISTTLVGGRDLSPEQSLYFEKDVFDAEMGKAGKRAEQLGLEYYMPTLFKKKSTHIHFGARALTEAPMCFDPWKTCYLTVDEDGRRQMIFCCSGFYYEIEYDKNSLDEERFQSIWNHPTAQYFRRTVNRKEANPICTYCTTVDRFDPNNRELYGINEKIKPYFAEVNRRYLAGNADIGGMCEDVDRLLK